MKKKVLAVAMMCVMVFGSAVCCNSAQAANKPLSEIREEMRALYGENKKITDGNYDKSLAVKCVNGT